ncbi:PAS domain S-box-containing protein [Halovenus aranensis]|uniref:PAS domain S-box-containing protein n=1 Tax=Halovenus aranensis TaxID=890420 RepID=A0A1G8SQD0_9EURY|nr:GAF domain-containing protein [Halovenus aranensis]SDJ30820.1 PAS domain S-box-containing protein [Halovenus aranensis]
MYAFTEPPEILFITGREGDAGSLPSALGDERSLSRLTWSKETEPPAADCVLLSDTLDPEQVVDVTRSFEASDQSIPVIAFVGDRAGSVERLFDAGVTDVIHASPGATAPAVIDRRIEAALALAEQTPEHTSEYDQTPLLREVTENINDVVWLTHVEDEAEIQYVNNAYEEVWGRSPEHLYEDRMSLLETVHPDDRERLREALQKQVQDPDSYDEMYRVVRPDGQLRWVHSRSVGIREEGELVRIVGIVTDITERKTNQQQLAAERDLVERILETSTVGIVVIDTDRTIVRANEQAATVLGTSQHELQGCVYSPEDVRIRGPDGDELPESAFPFNRIKRTGEPLEDEQLVVDHPDGDETIISVDGVPMFDDDSLERVVLTIDDVTARATREQRLEEQRDELADLDHINRIIRGVQKALLSTETRDEILQAVCENLTTADRYQDAVALQSVGEEALHATAWTEGAGELVDALFSKKTAVAPAGPVQRALATAETQVCHPATADNLPDGWRGALQSAAVESVAAIPIVYDGTDHGVIVVFSAADTPGCARKRSVFDELGETVGHAIAAVDSRQREETLTALYEATRQFLTAETPREISDVAVNTATDVLDLSGIGIFLFDEETNLLEPVADTEQFLEFFGESPVFGPGKGDSITWHTYVTGEPQCFADVRNSDRLAKPDTSARASLLIPLGEHGVFAAASRESGVFTGQRRKLVGLLATTVETALDRVAGQADIRERDAALEERARELERADRLLSASRTLMEVMRDATTRQELEADLCKRLVEETALSFAWVGHRPADSDTIEPRSWAGVEDGYLDAVSLAPESEEPAVRAADSGVVTTVSNVATQMREQSWAREAIERGFQSVLAIPLGYGETDYGVLTVYGPEPTVRDDGVTDLVVEFGSAIAYGINSVETRRGMLADGATEIEVSLGQTETFLNAIATLVDEPVSYREITPLADRATQVLFSLSDPPIEQILALDREFVAVESLTHTRRENTHLFRATLSEKTVGTDILDCGGIPQSVTATPETTRATVRLSTELTVREFLDRLGDQYAETELLARHPAGDTVEGGNIRSALDDRLTDRQREVLVSAYESGFFESPRETTGEELAALLDLSQPTVTHHLREAQRRLFSCLLDD